jgi:hypothetical protein
MHEDEHEHPHDSHDWAGQEPAAHSPSLDLGEEERLPWLESADDIETEHHRGSNRRLAVFGVVAALVLALLVQGIYWVTHRGGSAKPADGSLIEASKEPYKVAPSDPGGKKFAGTGDASFKVSHGEHPDASLAGSAGTTPAPATPTPSPTASASAGAAPAPAAKPSPAAPASAPAHATGGVAVQVGAYSTNALAESAWSRLSGSHDLLKGVGHRVVEGKLDIGTVYRLQAMTADVSAANSLCSHLEADGVKCQVKK